MKLFDLAPAYEQALSIITQMEEDGCTADELEEAMKMVDQIEGDLNTKCLNIASWVRNLEAEAKAIKEAQDAMDKRRKAATAKADSLRNYLFYGLKLAGVTWNFSTSARYCCGSKRSMMMAVPPWRRVSETAACGAEWYSGAGDR